MSQGSGQYQGSDISTGTQTPEAVTTPTDIFDSGIAGGSSMEGGNNA
ncbi:hypothetical protein [Flavisolibacter ginsengisoli]|jgi:hypothetical protein|nr:hypothetical protein [Flavisolibacter ginsengisoli]